MANPLVSIGLPVYNGAPNIRHALDAILNQTCSDLELVVSDNASTDATSDICLEYAARDVRIKYHRNDVNIGGRANFNRVFELARGTYFHWHSHNDWIAPTYLERCIEAFDRDQGIVACYTSMALVPHDQPATRSSEPHVVRIHVASAAAGSRSLVRRHSDSLWSMPYHPIYGLYHRDVLAETDLILNCPESDRILLAQVAMLGRFGQVPEMLFFQRGQPPDSPRNTWIWLDPSNVDVPKRRVQRLVREHWRSVDRYAHSGAIRRAMLKSNVFAYVALQSIRGKLKQHAKRRKLKAIAKA